MSLRSACTLLLLALALGACFPSNILAPGQRQVLLDSTSIEWRPPIRNEIEGLYASTEIEGPMAGVLRNIVYYFDSDGSYTAAALFFGPPMEFQVLRGSWTLEGTRFQLDDADPAQLEAGLDCLRIRGAEGSLVLKHE